MGSVTPDSLPWLWLVSCGSVGSGRSVQSDEHILASCIAFAPAFPSSADATGTGTALQWVSQHGSCVCMRACASPHMARQVRVSCGLEGLRSFFYDQQKEQWASWRDLYHIALVSDQGADMVPCMHSVEYCAGTKLVVTTYYDIEHGTNRNLWGAIGAAGLKPLMLLVMLVLNLPSMPDDPDLRFRQVKDLMAEHYRVMTPETSPLFQYMAADLHRERSADISDGENEAKGEALWRLLAEDSYFRKKQGRCCIARFCAIVGLSRKVVASWHSHIRVGRRRHREQHVAQACASGHRLAVLGCRHR